MSDAKDSKRSTPRLHYAGPSVTDVAERLKAAGVDEGLIVAYIAEEARRNPTEWQRMVASINQFRDNLRRMFGPRYSQADYALTGPTRLPVPPVSDYGHATRPMSEGGRR